MKNNFIPFTCAAALLVTSPADAADIDYDGHPNKTEYTFSGLWAGGSTPTLDDSVLFPDSAPTPATLTTDGSSASLAGQLILDSSYGITGSNVLSISAGDPTSSRGISEDVLVRNSSTFTASAPVTFVDDLASDVVDITAETGSSADFSGLITGTANAVDINFIGDISATGGIDNSSTGEINLLNSGTALEIGGTVTAATININSGTTLEVASGTTLTDGSGGLVLSGSGTVSGDSLNLSGQSIKPTPDSGGSTPFSTLTLSSSTGISADTNTEWLLDVNFSSGEGDEIVVGGSGNLALAGTLSLNNLGGNSIPGGELQIFSGSNYTGSFDNVVPALPGNWEVEYRTDGIYVVIPEMGTVAPLLAVLTPFFFGRRSRKKA